MTMEERTVALDRMRYTKDKLASGLVLLSIVFNALYFVKLYQMDVGTYFYKWQIGASVIYNLLFMLMAFLSSEGVKSRKTGYPFMLIFLGIMQAVRIFYLPAQAYGDTVEINNETIPVMTDGTYFYVVICLAVSAVCCLAAAVISFINTRKLTQYLREIENQSA